MKNLLTVLIFVTCIVESAYSQENSAKELLGDVTIGSSPSATGEIDVPVILRGEEAATFLANGGTSTTSDSIYGQMGLQIKLNPGNNSIQQARDYLTGKSPFYRGTFQMACLFSEQFNADPRTKPVMVLQHSYSFADYMVSTKEIKTLNDLKGKRICLQQGGPHLDLVEDSLKAAGITWTDVIIVWVKNLTGTDSPADMLRKEECDVACVITPDMIGLCSGIDQIGSGAEGTVEGAHVVNSTTTIADVFVCRKDFFDANREWVENFVVGYLRSSEQIVSDRKKYSEGETVPQYVSVMKQLQSVFGSEALPTIEQDVHSLILDCDFARIPGNESFFNDPDSLTGFKVKQTAGLELAVSLGYSTQKLGFETAEWDYRRIAERAGVHYTEPDGQIKTEISDLDNSAIFSFKINFEPEQTSFPLETYASDFKRFCEAQETFGNATIIIEGHSDPTLALQHLYWAAKAKGLLTGSNSQYQFDGKSISLTQTDEIANTIQLTSLTGQKHKDSNGHIVEIPDPKATVAAALALSQSRAVQVKDAIESFAKDNGYQIDLSAVVPRGVGIADPIHARPKNLSQAKENMRVVFRVVRVNAETLSENDLNFGK